MGTVSATFAPETQDGKESTEGAVTRAVKAMVAKRSKDGVFSLKNSRTGISLNLAFSKAGDGAGPAMPWPSSNVFSTTRPLLVSRCLGPDGKKLGLEV
jgi:hypothetical protein